MTTNEIRAAFLKYFERQGHLPIPSASLVPFEDDPSVLLTIAGMQPLKSYFLGADTPPARRMTSSQKCFRTNDIDQVGYTARHLTFFEMLGNFSIGDYFKDDAIRFGWEVSTEVFGLDPEKIWITVFEGMEGVPGDDEALERWVEMGVPRERIQRLGEADNFWKAGPTGPCGPNTELYLDRGPAFGPEGGPAGGGDRYLEYWNLVFMQYDRAADGSLSPLPAKNIDTGAGLERLAAILQDVPSVFETDGFRPLIAWAEGASRRRYGADPRDDRALRVLADHGRAMTFLAADGVVPGNEGRDYVLRRIIRRAVSEAGHLGLEPGAIADLAAPVVEGWGEAYPELAERAGHVRDVLGAEAEQFARTLSQGRRLLEEVIDRSRAGGTVSGDDAFRLYDTFGFPLDLTLEAAQDAGLAVDEPGFEALMDDQRRRSRGGATAAERDEALTDLVSTVARESDATEFVGWDSTAVDTRIIAIEELGDGTALLKLEQSPFYPEGGGQVSDIGEIVADHGRASVIDAFRLGSDQVLRVRIEEGELPVDSEVWAAVDAPRRRMTRANHTATHVLSWALRETLGDGVRQAGSYVGPDKLRFDFTHRGRVAPETLREIERMVNARVDEDQPVTWRIVDREAASDEGAIGLFEEKYGERVRVVFNRRLLQGALRRHPRGPHRRHRPLRDRLGGLHGGGRAAHRGAHRHRRRRLPARARAPAHRGAGRTRRAHPGAGGRPQARPLGPHRCRRGRRPGGRGRGGQGGLHPGGGDGHGRAARALGPGQAVGRLRRRGGARRRDRRQGRPGRQPQPGGRRRRPVGRRDHPRDRPDRRRRGRGQGVDGPRRRQGPLPPGRGPGGRPGRPDGITGGVKVLALDHGAARTGVAVSDPTGTIARPLPAIARVNSPAGRRELDAVIAREAPALVVVGEPRSMSGDRGAQARAAAGFAGRLRARTAVPVEMWDERLTTVEAGRRGREGGSRADLDSLAACVLLEAYLAARA